jgi:hypothetical protein
MTVPEYDIFRNMDMLPHFLKGKIHGTRIELNDRPPLPDGTEVEVQLRVDRLAHLERAFGGWRDDPDLDQALAQIERERHEARLSPA